MSDDTKSNVNDIEELRKSFRPDRITTLFVGESAPSGPGFFYKGNSNLFREMKKAFNCSNDFLAEFRQKGFYLDDLVSYPVNHMPQKEKASHYRNGMTDLSDRIHRSEPAAIVTIGRGVDDWISKAAHNAGYKGPIFGVPFPGGIHKNVEDFRAEMAEIIPQLPVTKQPEGTPQMTTEHNKNHHPTLTGSEILWATLVGEGVDRVFGYPGGAILPIYDALRKFPIHHILVRHEQGASHMADGYARASGKVGVCMATSGPGATNLVTGIATAMLDSIPIVAITGQVSSKVLGSDAFQEVDITGITLPITKHNFLVTRAEDIAPTVSLAFQIAQSGRPGPVLIDITKDAQQATATFDFAAAAPPAARPHPMLRAESASLQQAIELIKQSKKPVILAGHGIIQSGAEAQVIAFAERHQIPVASTLLGLGAFPTHHPLSLGMMGMHGESWVNHAIQRADLLLAFGMRFDDRVTGNLASYAQNAKKIHIEIDPSEINKNVKVDVALIGDLRETLDLLLPLLPKKSDAKWLREINAMKGDASVRDIINLPDNGHLYAAHVINDIWQEARAAGRLEQTIIVTDVGQHQMWEAQYYKHDVSRTLVTSGGLGTMGFALPAAIGAKVACPEKDVWVIAGDGGFQMTAAELSTIVQENLAINIAVINNGFLGMVRQWQEAFYDKNYSASPILSPDFVKLAAAHGIDGAHVSERKNVIPTVTKARTSGKAFLINFQVEKEDGVYPMIAPGAALHEMVRRPTKDPLLETAEDE